MAEARFYRNDTDGSLKAAALQAAVALHIGDPRITQDEKITDTAAYFYEWLRETN